MSLLLDTHVWLWWLTGAGELSRSERRALDATAEHERPAISAISLWEAQMLVAKKRLRPTENFQSWIESMGGSGVVVIMPLGIEVVQALHELPLTFHGDPADRVIVATARAHAMPLATHDSAIRRARVVTIWKP